MTINHVWHVLFTSLTQQSVQYSTDGIRHSNFTGLHRMSKSIGWRVLAALLGLVAILLGYFCVHKPLYPALLLTLGGGLLDVLSAILIISIGGGLGRRIIPLIAKTIRHTAPNTNALSQSERVAL